MLKCQPQTGILNVDGWAVEVLVTNQRTVFGRLDYEVQQAQPDGSQRIKWVEASRVQLNPQ
jgi:hypothetical protein